MYKWWTEAEDSTLKTSWKKDPKTTLETLSKMLPGRTPKAIQARKKKLGLVTRRRGRQLMPVRKDFFTSPTVLSAYYAGFIAADGCVTDDMRLSIQIHNKDQAWLQQFLDNFRPGYTVVPGKTAGFAFRNMQQPCADLKQVYNVVPRKSNILLPPHLSDAKLVRAYCCGYIDGDGCISFNPQPKRKKDMFQLQVTGTQEVMQWMADEVVQTDYWLYPAKDKVNTWRLHQKGSNALNTLMYLAPSDLDLPVMQRKWSNVPAYQEVMKAELQ